MKRIFSLLLALLMIISMCGCQKHECLTCEDLEDPTISTSIGYLEEEEMYLQAKKYTRSHNIEYELESERKKLKTLEDRMVQLHKESRIGLILSLLSVLGLAFAETLSQIIPNAYPCAQTMLFSIPGIFTLILGVNMVYQYYKHAPGKFSRFFSGIKNYVPLPLQMEKCKLNIRALEEKLAQENELGPIYSDEIIYADF